MVKVISLPYIFQVLYVLCFTWTRYQVSVYRTIGPLVTDVILSSAFWSFTKATDTEGFLFIAHQISLSDENAELSF